MLYKKNIPLCKKKPVDKDNIPMNKLRNKKGEDNRQKNLFISQTSLWIVLPYIILYETIAVVETLLLNYYGNSSIFQTTETIRNTFTIVVGFVVGYVVTISFEAGKKKFVTTSHKFYTDILYGSLTFSIELTSLVRSRITRGGMQGNESHTMSSIDEIRKILVNISDITACLPELCMHLITEEVKKIDKMDVIEASLGRSEENGNCSSRLDLFNKVEKIDMDTLPGLRHSVLYNSMNINRQLARELAKNHVGDTIRTIQLWYLDNIHRLNRIDAIDDNVGYNRCIEHVNVLVNAVSGIQASYAIGIPPVYKRFVGIAIHLYILCVPVLIYTQQLWWLILIIYPVMVYLFISPHVIGSRISNSVDYANNTTKLPVAIWCSDTTSMITGIFDKLENDLNVSY